MRGRLRPPFFMFGRNRPAANPPRLHIGCGTVSLAGWINIDLRRGPGVDRVLDVRRGLPYREVEFIFAEHFLEHLHLDDALRFLIECRRALSGHGVLRVSTPNLDWVIRHVYHEGAERSAADRADDCLLFNRALRGWGHQFVYNEEMLQASLRAAGFGRIDMQTYGVSDHPALQSLESHERDPDTPELPHVLIAEASGHAEPQPVNASLLAEYRRDV